MKPDIHPEYQPVAFVDRATGDVVLTRSTAKGTHETEVDGVTYPAITVDITSYSHPFWTGTSRALDTEGRIEKFRRRYAKPGTAK